MKSPRALPRRFPLPWWIVLLLVATSFVAWDAIVRSRHILEVSKSYGVTVDEPRVDAHSVTGYENGRRSLILPSAGADTAHWLMQTQMMFDEGKWRIRKVAYDNAPRGREVHWGAPFRWWLAAMAWIDHTISNRPWGIAVERATLSSGPVMLVLCWWGLLPLISRKFSSFGAIITVLGMVAVYPFYLDFLPGRADHHGLANICGLLTVLFFLVDASTANSGGDLEKQDKHCRAARKWLVGSGMAGGVGLWISAATQIPVLVGVGLGVIVAAVYARKSPVSISWISDPRLLRLWGIAGGAVSLVAYLIEYCPSGFGFRLEVNHPLYAFAWIGAAEGLRMLILILKNGKTRPSRCDVAAGVAAIVLILIVPAIILATGDRSFVVTDSFTWKLHSLHISEFQGLARYFSTKGLNWGVVALALPMVLLVPVLGFLWHRNISKGAKAQVVFALMPALLGWAMGWAQIRWLGLAFALSVPAVVLFFREIDHVVGGIKRIRFFWLLAGIVVLVPGGIVAIQRTLSSTEFTQEEIRSSAERDVAHWLRLRTEGEKVIVAASPSPTTRLIYFGGLTGVGTLYWENKDGLKNSAALFAASSNEAARELALRFGVTHIVLFSWDAFEIAQAKLYRNLPEDAAIPGDLFIANLLSAPIPPAWLRGIPFVLPDNTAVNGEQIRIWEVVAPQSPESVSAHAANYYLEMGMPQVAAKLVPVLSEFPADLPANVMLAAIAVRQDNRVEFDAAMNRVIQLLPRAGLMSLDDRLALVVVLAVSGRAELARQQLQMGMATIDEHNIRLLTPGMLSDLLALTEALAVNFPDPQFKQLALKLLPPSKRQPIEK